jgi:N-acetylmuramoyl-L-alanine amidase
MIEFKRQIARTFAQAAVLAAAAWMLVGGIAAAAGDVTGLRLGERSQTDTRIVFDLDAKPTYRLSADREGAGRLIVKIDGLARKPAVQIPRVRGHVMAISSDFAESAATFSFSLSKPALVSEAFVIPPSAQNGDYRLVIDLKTAPSDQVLAGLPAPFESITDILQAAESESVIAGNSAVVDVNEAITDAPRENEAAENARMAQPTLRKKLIVVDAGHGGSDPGAIGARGTKEADVTIAAAKVLQEALEATGRYEVFMTRKNNERLALEERSKLAREAGAELFISLHADALENKKVRGASVYTLSEEGFQRSANEALSKEVIEINGVGFDKDSKVIGGILYGVTQRETGTASAKFAEILVSKLSGVTVLLNNSHRTENLKVLLAPDVPAVLFELAYISNASDETNLRSPAWRKRTMGAVVNAIDAYFESEAKERHARNAAAN